MEKFGFLLRDNTFGMVYNGNIQNLDRSFDAESAVRWWKQTKDSFTDVEMMVYGNKSKFSFPIIEDMSEEYVDYTQELLDYITKKAQAKLVRDDVLGAWTYFLREYHPISVRGGPIMFLKLKLEQKKEFDSTELGSLVMMKEALDDYKMIDDYKLIVRTMRGTEEIKIPLFHDYEILHPISKKPIIIENNYTVGLRNAMFGEAASCLSEDGRNVPLLQRRQYDVIKRMGHITYFAAPRRAGKTFLLVFLAIREIMRQSSLRKNKFRPITVLYIGLSDPNLQPVVQYAKKMIEQFGQGGEDMFHYDPKFGRLSFRSGKKVLGQINFISAQSNEPGIGHFADLVIIDEAGKIKKNVFDGIQPIVMTEGAKLVCASTLYVDSQKGFFFHNLIDAERKSFRYQDIDHRITAWYDKSVPYEPGVVGIRYDIDDLDLVSEKVKKRMKESYRNDPDRYLSELYSRFPEEGKVFKYEQHLKEKEELHKKLYNYVAVGYDPALTYDFPGLVTVGFDPNKKKFVVLEEHELPKTQRYQDQEPIIKNVIKNNARFVQDESNMFFAMDGTQKANADLLLNNNIHVDFRAVYTAGTQVVTTNIDNEYRIPKRLLVETVKTLFDNGLVELCEGLTNLQKELDYFQQAQTPSGGITYEGAGAHDDYVNAMMIAIFFMYYKLGLKFEVLEFIQVEPNGKITIKERREMSQRQYAEKRRQEQEKLMKEHQQSFFRKYVY